MLEFFLPVFAVFLKAGAQFFFGAQSLKIVKFARCKLLYNEDLANE